MLRRFKTLCFMLFGLLALCAGSAQAYGIKTALITRLTCTDYTISLEGSAVTGDRVDYQFTLTPASGPATTVSGSILVDGLFETSVSGSFTLATTGTFTAEGTATFKNGAGATVNFINIRFDDTIPLVCPGTPQPKITIRTYTNGHDGDNVAGVPTPGPGDFSPSNTVALLSPGNPFAWIYRVMNMGAEPLVNVQVNDNRIGPIVCPKSTLAVGETMDCSANATAASLSFSAPVVVQGCGDKRPTYNNTGTATGLGQTSGIAVTDNNPSHYCNPAPACNLGLSKTCEIVQAATSEWSTCRGKLQRFSMIWPADAGTVNISGVANDAPGGVVNPGQRVTFNGPFSVNDQVLNITGASNGQSVFHVSCSDADMDGRTSTNLEQQQLPGKAQDCGKFQGNGKSAVASRINRWLLDGLVDADGKVLNCTPAPSTPTSSCSFVAGEPPQCGTGGSYKPSTLTFQYTGGGCSTQSHSQAPGKSLCSGAITPSLPVNVTFPGGSALNVMPGGTFTMPRTQSNSVITLTNAGGTENITVHTSCSQPLIVGDVFFSLTLVAEDGVGIGQQITYNYDVTNNGGATATGISVTDDKLGLIGNIGSLAAGARQRLSVTTLIGQTTTNVATATSAACPAPGVQATATVTVLPPPPCTVTETLGSIGDDTLVYKVTNGGSKVVTLDTLMLNFPAARQRIKTVQAGKDVVYDASKSSLVVVPGVLIGASHWTNTDATKRQWKAGETQDLKITFTTKAAATPAQFSGTAGFQEGCQINLAP